MDWRFTLIGRNGLNYEISEPIGWDGADIVLSRDLDTHGIFFDFQGNTFEFDSKAMTIIRSEQKAKGVEGDLVLVIEQRCTNEFKELYRGKLVFEDYDAQTGEGCSVKIPIETTNDVMLLRNRWDQKVNLLTDFCFDETTALLPYQFLGKTFELPSKGILLQNKAESDILTNGFIYGVPPVGINGSEFGMIPIAINKTICGEIGGFNVDPSPTYESCFQSYTTTTPNIVISAGSLSKIDYRINLDYISPNVNYADGMPNFGQISDTCEIDIRAKGKIEVLSSKINAIAFMLFKLDGAGNRTMLSLQEIYNLQGSDKTTGYVLNFDKSYYNAALELNSDDRIYAFLHIYHFKTVAQQNDDAFKVTFDVESKFKMETLSHQPATPAKMFMINEALSRTCEAITDNKIRVYSDHFGRTDSEPYSHLTDGCGSLEAITKGLFIRRQENRNPTDPFLMTISMKELWDGLEPIHHVGFGIERDPSRPGFKRLRVEHWQHFYGSDVIMDCIGINKINRKVVKGQHYTTIELGYKKWEAEEYNGLDEILTKRTWRTTLTQVKNAFSKLSDFVLSGYAWEITRRKGSLDSKDWRYDNDNFLMCMKRNDGFDMAVDFIYLNLMISYDYLPNLAIGQTITITGSTYNNGTYTVAAFSPIGITGQLYPGYLITVTSSTFSFEVGGTPHLVTGSPNDLRVETGNVSSPQNIIDPPTILNYRHTPARLALRWMDWILSIYKKQDGNSKIIFTDGVGNYVAKGELTNTNCKWENAPLKENDTISSAVFADPAVSNPLLSPERVEFEYPMSLNDYLKIEANYYGLIYYSDGIEIGYGWIDKIKYKPEDGTATFTLIPKYYP